MSTQLPNAATDTGEALPKRTTPTWEMEILLSGATVFALFQAYSELNVAVFWLLERLPNDLAGLISPVGLYLQGGVLGLALGFLAHLVLRAVWVSLVGLRSVDPEGQLRHNPNIGPVQRALLGETLDGLPQRIGALDDASTLVFGAAIGIAKLMLGLTLTVGGLFVLAYGIAAAFGTPERIAGISFALMALWLGPMMAATLADNHAGKHGRTPRPWVTRVIRLYSAAGYMADGNLGATMATYRVAGAKRGWRAQLAIGLLVSSVVAIAVVAPFLQYRGIAGWLDGDFPSLRAGDAGALRTQHYLDRQRVGEVHNAPALPSDVIAGAYARLWIPYVPEWHDPALARCTPDTRQRWLADAKASRAVLDCLAATQPITLDGQAVATPWWWSVDDRHGRQGFQVMIDLRSLGQGPFVLEITQPEAVRRLDDDATADDDTPWRIPFWR